MCLCVCECRCSWSPKEGIGSFDAGVNRRLRVADVGAGNWTLLLWKSSKCFWPLSHVFSFWSCGSAFSLKVVALVGPLVFRGHNGYSSTMSRAWRRPEAFAVFVEMNGFQVCRMNHFIWFKGQDEVSDVSEWLSGLWRGFLFSRQCLCCIM